MAARNCSLPQCNFKGATGLYRFPRNELIKQKWIQATGIQFPNSYTRICKHHFKTEDFLVNKNGQTIKRKAVPCFNLCSKISFISQATDLTLGSTETAIDTTTSEAILFYLKTFCHKIF